MKYLRIALAACCALALAAALGSASASAATRPRSAPTGPSVAEASIIQGLPQTSVDVYLNGTLVAQNLRFRGVIGPVPLAPGAYHIAIRLHDAKPHSKPLLQGRAVLVAGANVTVVTELTPTGTDALHLYRNPTAAIGKGRAVLAVRNDAEDAGFTVYAGGLRIFNQVENPHSRAISLPAQWTKVRFTDVGSTTTALGPVPLHLAPQTVTVVYAIGDPATSTLTDVVQSFATS